MNLIKRDLLKQRHANIKDKLIKPPHFDVAMTPLGSLSNDDDDGNENATKQ